MTGENDGEQVLVDADLYLARIGLNSRPSIDLAGLAELQLAHLRTVPFENIDVYDGTPVRTDLAWSIDKVVNRRRGGWCFEVNGAFGALLDALGFDVTMLGAAVLLAGPNAIVDHLTLEVSLDRSYLVDVGFGNSFISPLDLNSAGHQDGGSGTFEFIDSSQGRTLTRHDDVGVPVPQYRFKRNRRALTDFDESSARLQSDRSLHWSQKPFATRLLDAGPDRITLLRDRMTVVQDGVATETPVPPDEWNSTLAEHFSMHR
jgi:N-hydroxyarylamine O-acetyltransferase